MSSSVLSGCQLGIISPDVTPVPGPDVDLSYFYTTNKRDREPHCHTVTLQPFVLIITSVSELHIKRSIAHDQDVLTQQIPNNSHVFLIYEFRTHLEQLRL